jgi:Icc protein
MVKKRLRWFNYARGFALLLALAFLFIGLLLGESPSPLYGPVLQKRGSEAPSDSFRFAVLSDSHKGWGVFKPIMREIARDGYPFAVHCGDLVAQGKEDRYRFFFRELAEVRGKTPFYFVPGNHDVYDKSNTYSLKNFHTYCGPDHYWFSWGNAAFVVLNDAQSTISEDQSHWLETTLRKLRGTFTHIFVFMHVPPFDPREGHSYCLPEMIGKRFMRLMEEFGVDYVFSGHLHCYFRKVINEVTYIGSPSSGGAPRCANPSYGYIQVAVHGRELKDSVIKVEKDWWLQLKGDIQYELCARSPFLLPFLTVVLGQSSLYFLAA